MRLHTGHAETRMPGTGAEICTPCTKEPSSKGDSSEAMQVEGNFGGMMRETAGQDQMIYV